MGLPNIKILVRAITKKSGEKIINAIKEMLISIILLRSLFINNLSLFSTIFYENTNAIKRNLKRYLLYINIFFIFKFYFSTFQQFLFVLILPNKDASEDSTLGQQDFHIQEERHLRLLENAYRQFANAGA